MNRTTVLSQPNQMLGNDIMNPRPQQKWMEKSSNDSSALAYLKRLDSLIARQVLPLTELMSGIPSQAQYGIFNDKHEQIYYAFEESSVCQRLYCLKTRRFDLHIVDSTNQEIIRVRREFRCCAGRCSWFSCCAGCQQEVAVESPPGNVIGYVTQQCSFWRLHYDLKDANGNVILTIVGPGCLCDGTCGCYCETEFTLFGTDGTTEIGAIVVSMTTADQFVIRIPIDLNVKTKAVALGALFLIGFSHFVTVPYRAY